MWIWAVGVGMWVRGMGDRAGPLRADEGTICIDLVVKQWGARRVVCKKNWEEILEECPLRGQAEVGEKCQEGKGEDTREVDDEQKTPAPDSPDWRLVLRKG